MDRMHIYRLNFIGLVFIMSTLISLPVSAHCPDEIFEYNENVEDQSMMEQGAMNNGQKMMGERTRRHYLNMMNESGCVQYRGMMWGLDRLNLTVQQMKRMDTLQDQFRRLQLAEMGHIRDQQFRLLSLLKDKQSDAKMIKKIYATIFDHRRKLMESKIELQNRILNLLTEDQQE